MDATSGIGLLQTILSGGPLLILAVLVVIEGYVIHKMAGQITTLEADFRESSIALLQDQIKQSEPLTEALTKTNTALERIDITMQEASQTMTRLKAELDIERRSRDNT
jgi:septal ring factor EnvC (AmiA/AmiB activator)